MALAVAKFLKRLFGLEPHQWPEGDALISPSGFRYGTKTANGIVLAPGVEFVFAPVCSRCQQAIEAESHQQNSEGEQQQARHPVLAGE